MPNFVRVCALEDIPLGEMRRLDLEDGPGIVIIRAANGLVSALQDRCSHGEFPLSDGYLEGELLECPLHGAKFCVRTGRPQTPPATLAVERHDVKIEDGNVYVDTQPAL
ncbi:MAG: non-heme iron oxygenase ferredoxin subunit [Hyphomonadaceae bacterium]|nr:non-heme iron oxygenase ferredoxin subunit [Hyphomonadaceae bacterium]